MLAVIGTVVCIVGIWLFVQINYIVDEQPTKQFTPEDKEAMYRKMMGE